MTLEELKRLTEDTLDTIDCLDKELNADVIVEKDGGFWLLRVKPNESKGKTEYYSYEEDFFDLADLKNKLHYMYIGAALANGKEL